MINLKITIAIFAGIISVNNWGQSDSVLYSFFVAGHTYGKAGQNNIGLHPPFIQKFEYIKSRPEIELGVLLGDIVSHSPTAKDWDEVDENIDSLGLPVYFAVGNHDIENRLLFENRYGRTYYSFEHQNDLFIVLDPNIDNWNISKDQLKFLKNTVNEYLTTIDNIYVFFHQILWLESNNEFNYITWNSHEGRADSINFWTEVEPIFRNLSNKVIMFAGDLGGSWSSNITFDEYENITLIATGMGDENGDNFVVINVYCDKSVSYDLICLSDQNINCLGNIESYQVVDKVPCPKVSVFPNPTLNYINVCYNIDVIQIFDLQGHLLFSGNYFESKSPCQTINTSNIPSGNYLIRTIGSCDVTSKLIKK